MEASIPSSLSRLRTLSEQLEKKIEESQELARDAAIAVERHVSPLRGPFKGDELMLRPFKDDELMLSPFKGDELMLRPFKGDEINYLRTIEESCVLYSS
ncbi:hypothetical protein GmHk_12G035871 [Glycine max]|nr:hypothetical protein GmHk_12G035871 [Glycine max]